VAVEEAAHTDTIPVYTKRLVDKVVVVMGCSGKSTVMVMFTKLMAFTVKIILAVVAEVLLRMRVIHL